MHYYIDGYNLLFQIAERTKTFTENRLLIIEHLAEFFNAHHLKGSLVFDSRFDLSGHFPSIHDLGSLEIIYSPKGLSADDYLVEILSICKCPKSITVITSDRYLSQRVQDFGCSLMNIEKFLKWTLKKKKQKDRKASYKKNIQDSDNEFKRLLNIFEKKLEDLDSNSF